MATRDITRSAYSRAKRYVDVHAQQGRLFTDSDQVEQAETRLEEGRRSRIDIIGPAGSPDDGFRISNPTANGGGIDFTIHAGTFYLGGHRLELLQDQTFQLQSDWLNNPGRSSPGANEQRRDMAVLFTWLQPVASSEDAETLEPGLGGPDTSTRLRPVTRVVLMEDVDGETCEEAWAEVLERLAASGWGTLSNEMELVPDTVMTIGLEPGSGGDDLCSPNVDGGYLGAENQAIRAVLTGDDRFIWGFDNAAPLYRVVLEDGGATIRFLTEPKDALHWPAPGQTVEIIPWGSVLANGEKLADESIPGHFATVEGGYDPDERRITLTPATVVPGGFGEEWQARSDAAALLTTRHGLQPLDSAYYFLRVWDRGTDTGPDPTLPLLPAPATLGTTGLNLTVNGDDQRPGDHVIVAARPATTDVVMPWELLVGTDPMGVRRFVAPLALIGWNGTDGEILHDCRPRFRPLTRMRGCCTYTVGDNNESFGDFSRIQDAINALPAHGGEVCVLPGVFDERFNLDGLENIRISGCGRRTRVVAPDASSGPLVSIRGGGGLQIENMAFEAAEGEAIFARGLIEDGALSPVSGLRLAGLIITARDRSAINARFVDNLAIRDCRITIAPLTGDLEAVAPAGQAPAVFAQGDGITIMDNAVRTPGDRSIVRASGGVQIGGGSDHVLIEHNLIAGGNGNGITLGHFVVLSVQNAGRIFNEYALVANAPIAYIAGYISIDNNGCIIYTPPGSGGGDLEQPPTEVPVSGGDLRDVVIRDNRITGMGLSGVASPIAIDPRRQVPVLDNLHGLQMDRNMIMGCAQLETPELAGRERLLVAFGGIALTSIEVGVISGNVIEANGRRHIDAICGISVLRAEGLSISDNRIVDNGPRTNASGQPRIGVRGGIRVLIAAPQGSAHSSAANVKAVAQLNSRYGAARTLSAPALLIHDNIVHQPLGKALQVMGTCSMSIVGNHLSSQGTTIGSLQTLLGEMFVGNGNSTLSEAELLYLAIERLLGTAATVINLGFSSELIEGLLFMALLRRGTSGLRMSGKEAISTRQPTTSWAGLARLLQGGEIQFNDNTVIQNFLDGVPSLTLSSGFFMSFDDVSVQDNTMVSHVDFASDFCLTNILGFGWSIRVSGNRFEETIFKTLNSAITFGIYNDTSHNQGTHCIDARGPQQLLIDGPNRTLVQAINPLACGGCLVPPFDELPKTATDKGGNFVSPRLAHLDGAEGLWFGDNLVVNLPNPVDGVKLTLYGVEASAEVIVETSSGAKQTQTLNMFRHEATAEFDVDNITSISVLNASSQVLVTGLCVDRPNLTAVGGGDIATGGNYITGKSA
ncbi:DUF6519 domain-containing protein [Hoeflea sp.]|uniref:DUF6519 domain-containing protein n=1 Tax=Hoeflea sp. TaxID=1940281 RepID=UPI003B02D869